MFTWDLNGARMKCVRRAEEKRLRNVKCFKDAKEQQIVRRFKMLSKRY